MSRVFSDPPDDSAEQPLRRSVFSDPPTGPDPLHTALRLTADQPPDRAARILKLQTRTGLPTAVIDRNLDELEKQSAAADFDPETFRRETPLLHQWLLENSEHAALTRDDREPLSTLEQMFQFVGNAGRSLAASFPSTNAALWRALEAPADILGAKRLSQTFESYAQSQQQLAGRWRPDLQKYGFVGKNALQGMEGLGQMLLLFPAVLQDPALAGGMFGAIGGGEAYGEAKQKGLSPLRAATYATAQGAITGVLTELPIGALSKEFAANSGFARTLLNELKTAVPAMQVQTLLLDLNRQSQLEPGKTLGAYLEERPEAAASTLINTLVGVLGQTAATRGLARITKPFLDDVGQHVQESKTGQRSPEKLQEFLQRVKSVDDVYIPVEDAQQYFQSKNLNPADVLGPEAAAKYQQSLETRADIAVPMEDYATRIAGNAHGKFFNERVRLGDPERMTSREEAAFRYSPADLDIDPAERSIDESAAKIREDIIGQLVGEGYSPEAVEAHARFMETAFRNFVGERAGLDPYDVYQSYGTLITRALPEILTKLPNIDGVDLALDRLRSGRVPEPGEMFGVSLVDFLRQRGGVQDEGGELKALEVDADRKRGEKRLVQAKGLPLDRAREAAAEAGYLDKQSSVADFLDKIEQEVRGEPVYARGGENPQAMETATVLNQMQEYLQAVGVDVKTSTNEEIKKKLLDAAGGPEYAQSYGAGKRGGITFGRNANGERETRITLTTSANLSTLLHEFGHFWLETINDIADDLGKMNPENLSDTQRRIVQDRQTLLKYLGVDSRAGIGEPQHETFARSVEAYLAEAQAPSEELRSIFARFKQWLTNAYRLWKSGGATKQTIGAALDVQLNDEVRGVLDRLLASDDEIRRAEEQSGITGMFEDEQLRHKLGMSPAEYQAYAKLSQAQRDNARERVNAELVREAAREHEQWWKDQRAGVRNQVANEVYSDKAYRALSLLQTGRLPDGSEPPEGPFRGKLDAQALEDRYGKASTKPGRGSTIMNKLLQFDVYRRKGGVDPDVAAEYFGYRSGDELVNAIVNTRPMDALIEAETDSRMSQEYGDLQLSGEISQKAREAVMGPDRLKLLEADLQAIRKKQREVAPVVKAVQSDAQRRERKGRRVLEGLPSVESVKAWAERRIGDTAIRDLKPNAFWAAARKASQLAFEHASRDRWNNAYDQKLTELRSAALYQAAIARVESVRKNIDEFGRMFRSDAQLSKTHNMDYVNAARAIASTLLNYSTPYKEAAAKYLGLLQRYDPETFTAIEDQIAGVMESARPYKNMTADEFDGAADVVNGLFDLARRSRQIEIDGKLMDRETAIRELHLRASEVAKPGREQQGYKSAVSKWDKTVMQFQAAGSALRRMEFFIDAFDGGNIQGPFRRLLWNPISEALNAYRVAKAPVMERFLEILKPVESSIGSGKIRAGELDYTFANKGELLHAILHSGNESNFRKLLVGRGWGQLGPDGSLDTSRFDTFIDRMKREGVLTKQDYDFAQNMWDLLDSLKPGAQRAHKALYGSYFKEVEPQGFDAFGAHYRGGYVPAIVDVDVDAVAGIRADKQTFGEGDNPTMWPTTGRGFTKSRIEDYAGPLKLDLRLLPQHISKVLLFSHVQPAVKDVSRILLNREFQTIMGNVDPTLVPSLLIPWLQRSASQTSSTPIKGREGQLVSATARAIRQRTSMGMLTLNLADTIGRLTTVFPTGLKVRPDYLLSGLYQYLRAPRDVAEVIAEKSKFMASRGPSQTAQMQTAIEDIVLNRSAAGKVQDFAARHGHFLQAGIHNLLDHITWIGAADQASANGMSEPDAIRAADAAVRMTQSSYNPEDISRFEASSEPVKLVNMFFGYFNNQRQLLGNEFAAARQLGLAKGLERAAVVYTMGIMLPAVARELVYRAFGAVNVKQDEGWMDGFMDWFFGSQARYVASFIPGSGVVRAAADMWQRKPAGEHIEISPALPAVESAMRAAIGKSPYEAITTGNGKKKAIRDVLTLVTLLTGWNVQPAARPLGYLADVQEGKAQPESATDFARGLISGR